eukprot:TRINITY_DN3514_c1_g1_i1.p1 TRINITY_DN3514_c1_g1~~TRINITY_DN3514_c1_g1_i1.p1  ORF type:complete len:295 (-),score=84.04 TRINITY_DN3514_c1_g1_i1:341-1150(-)
MERSDAPENIEDKRLKKVKKKSKSNGSGGNDSEDSNHSRRSKEKKEKKRKKSKKSLNSSKELDDGKTLNDQDSRLHEDAVSAPANEVDIKKDAEKNGNPHHQSKDSEGSLSEAVQVMEITAVVPNKKKERLKRLETVADSPQITFKKKLRDSFEDDHSDDCDCSTQELKNAPKTSAVEIMEEWKDEDIEKLRSRYKERKLSAKEEQELHKKPFVIIKTHERMKMEREEEKMKKRKEKEVEKRKKAWLHSLKKKQEEEDKTNSPRQSYYG